MKMKLHVSQQDALLSVAHGNMRRFKSQFEISFTAFCNSVITLLITGNVSFNLPRREITGGCKDSLSLPKLAVFTRKLRKQGTNCSNVKQCRQICSLTLGRYIF